MDPFIVITVGLIITMVLERLFPRTKLVNDEGDKDGWKWITRAIFFNIIQLIIVLVVIKGVISLISWKK